MIAVLLLLLGLSFVAFSTAPSVRSQERPTAKDLAAARDLIDQLKASQEARSVAHLTLDARQIRTLAVLGGEASGLRRIEADVSDGVLSVRASLRLVGGLWVNTAAAVAGAHDGFPSVHLQVGRVTLPAIASRWSADVVRWLLVQRGVQLPGLDEVVRHVRVAEDSVQAELALPQRTGLIEQLVGTAAAPVDVRLIAQIYCRLTLGQDQKLAGLVQQAFADASGPDLTEYNRAAFVALGFYVVGEQVRPLAPAAADRIRRCPSPAGGVLLRGRDDLAKHWAFSAALTAILGERAAANLGEWKELHDSLPSGSGFSFVDLAADRSGLHVARGALSPQSAGRTVRALRTVSEDGLLPDDLAQAPEGFSDAAFVASFGGLEERRYRAAVSQIDQHLAHWAY